MHEIMALKRTNQNSMYLMLEDLRVGNAPGDMIDGIIVGVDCLVKTNEKYKFNRVMVLITDGETALEGLDDLQPIVETMIEKQISVYVLMLGKVVENKSSEAKVQSAKVLKTIAQSTGGRYMAADDLADCMPLLAAAPGLSTRPQQRKQVLEIAPYMRIPCIVWNKTSIKSLPSLKKILRRPGGAEGEEDGGKEGGGHGVEMGGGDEDMEDGMGGAAPALISRESRYMNPHDEGEEVSLEDRKKGFRYGSQCVPLGPLSTSCHPHRPHHPTLAFPFSPSTFPFSPSTLPLTLFSPHLLS